MHINHHTASLLPLALANTKLLSVSMDLLMQKFRINSTQYTAFCGQLLLLSLRISKFIHAIVCVDGTPFLLVLKQYSIVWIYYTLSVHSSVHRYWVVSSSFLS